MRKRAFTPDALDRLEVRIVLSHVSGLPPALALTARHPGSPGPPPGPVKLSAPIFGLSLLLVKNDFEAYALSGDFEHLRGQLATHTHGIPFHYVDGLDRKVNLILDQMQAELAAGNPHAINAAAHKVINGARKEVATRILDGSVVVVYKP